MEVIPFSVLWLEQDGKCYLCGGQMNPVAVLLGRPRDPLMASIEHRIPISRGGTHDRDNVSLAHFVCNMEKGARTLEEFTAA